MAAPRDYAREYANRIASGTARGLTPSQARGHPKVGETLASVITGTPLKGAAKAASQARQAAAAPRPVFLRPSVPWSRPTPGGTRDVRTAQATVVYEALLEAVRNGSDALVGIHAVEIDLGSGMYTDKNKRRNRDLGWCYTGRQLAEVIAQYCAGREGEIDLREGLREAMEQLTGTAVSDELEYIVKEFS